MAIRRATESDVPWISEQIENFIKSLGYAHAFLSDPDVREQILSLLVRDHLVLVSLDNYGPCGVIGGEYCRHPYNIEVKTLYEHFWWVCPDKRGAGHGSRLLQSFIEDGKLCADIIRVSLEHNSGIGDDKMAHYGLRLAEKTYIYEVDACHCLHQ